MTLWLIGCTLTEEEATAEAVEARGQGGPGRKEAGMGEVAVAAVVEAGEEATASSAPTSLNVKLHSSFCFFSTVVNFARKQVRIK
jgi:hypothetical protein